MGSEINILVVAAASGLVRVYRVVSGRAGGGEFVHFLEEESSVETPADSNIRISAKTPSGETTVPAPVMLSTSG